MDDSSRRSPSIEPSRESDPLMAVEISTDRLRLRRWTDADRVPFAELNADPVVMEHFPSTLTRVESDAFVDRIESSFDVYGYGLWAVEVRATGEFAGYVGLWTVVFDAPFTPAVEIGWRLAHNHWGRGYAPEAATAVLDAGFHRFGLHEIVSFTVPANAKSRRVMEKIGMTRNPADDFDHPNLPSGHSLQHHVLYRLSRAAHQSLPSRG